jgi:hypothetical protein
VQHERTSAQHSLCLVDPTFQFVELLKLDKACIIQQRVSNVVIRDMLFIVAILLESVTHYLQHLS